MVPSVRKGYLVRTGSTPCLLRVLCEPATKERNKIFRNLVPQCSQNNLWMRGRDLVLATKASVLSFYSNQNANPQCFRRRYRHSGSWYTYVAPGARASRCACNLLLVLETHDQKHHGTLLTTAKETVRLQCLHQLVSCNCCTMVATLWNQKQG